LHRRADRQRLAIAIGDVAAMRDDPGDALKARIALRRQLAVIDQLQVYRAAQQPCRGQQQQAEQQPLTRTK
jgi:hypothetical protein